MRASLLFRDRRILADGGIIDMVIWHVPTPVPPSAHSLKYRLFYGRPGKRIIGYDNERGKGDHRHRGDLEEPYLFVSIEQLLDDFEADVTAVRGAPI
jgi:hypothetical protein